MQPPCSDVISSGCIYFLSRSSLALVYICRNLESIKDREICCYSISCKQKDNIGKLFYKWSTSATHLHPHTINSYFKMVWSECFAYKRITALYVSHIVYLPHSIVVEMLVLFSDQIRELIIFIEYAVQFNFNS